MDDSFLRSVPWNCWRERFRRKIVDLQIAANEWNSRSSGLNGLRESVPMGPKTAPGSERFNDSVEVSLTPFPGAKSQVKMIVGIIFKTRSCLFSGELASGPANQSEMNPLLADLSQAMRTVTEQEQLDVGVSTRALFFICKVEFSGSVPISGQCWLHQKKRLYWLKKSPVL